MRSTAWRMRTQQRLEVELADDGAVVVAVRRRVDERPAAVALVLVDVPAEAAHVRADVLGPLLEGDEHGAVAVAADALDEELRGEHGLAGAGRAGDQRGAPCGRPPSAIRSRPAMWVGSLEMPPGCVAGGFMRAPPVARVLRQVETDEHAVEVGEVADDPAHRRREFAHHHGVARIFSSSASCGRSTMSITSTSRS